MWAEPGPDKPTRDTWLESAMEPCCHQEGRTWPAPALSPCVSLGTHLEEIKYGHFSKNVISTRLQNRVGDRPQGSWPPPYARRTLLSDILRSPVASPALLGMNTGPLGGVRQTTEPWGSQGRASDLRHLQQLEDPPWGLGDRTRSPWPFKKRLVAWSTVCNLKAVQPL